MLFEEAALAVRVRMPRVIECLRSVAPQELLVRPLHESRAVKYTLLTARILFHDPLSVQHVMVLSVTEFVVHGLLYFFVDCLRMQHHIVLLGRDLVLRCSWRS